MCTRTRQGFAAAPFQGTPSPSWPASIRNFLAWAVWTWGARHQEPRRVRPQDDGRAPRARVSRGARLVFCGCPDPKAAHPCPGFGLSL